MKKIAITALAAIPLVILAIVIFWQPGTRYIDEGDFAVELYVRADDVIFHTADAAANIGDSVFDVLLREMQNAGIHMEFRNTPGLGSAYVAGIDNIYEFDAGSLSGWMYRVNGEFFNIGASQHILQAGDVVEWLFTLDLGRDLGMDYGQ